eukprot:290226-Amorphochlora_amoeboformis.AAC.1
MISSLDDFYMMHDTKLSMIQTTNAVLNPDLFDLVILPALRHISILLYFSHNFHRNPATPTNFTKFSPRFDQMP